MTTLKSLVDETTNIKNEIVKCHSNLSSILTSKNVEVTEEDKMSDLIGKVDLLGDVPPPPLYLYKEGDKCVDVTGGWKSGFTYRSGSITFNSDHIDITTIAGVRTIVPNKKINVTKYKKLYVQFTANCNDKTPNNFFISKVGINQMDEMESLSGISTTGFTYSNQILTQIVDLANVNTDVYVKISNQFTATSKIHKIWLEK